MTRFFVVYKNQDGKTKNTEVTAKGKLDAARIILNTLAAKIIKVTPLTKGFNRPVV